MICKEEEMKYDICIIGGGPAGLTAAMYGARATLKTVLVEGKMPGGYMTTTDEIDNYPAIPEITGFELSQKMLQHAEKYDLPILYKNVVKIEKKADYDFCIHAEDGDIVETKSIIYATGMEPKALGIGEDVYFGKGLSFCATCDAPFFKDKIVTVIGGGDSALTEAIFLSRFVKKLNLIHRRFEFRGNKRYQEKVLNNDKIQVFYNYVAKEVHGDEKLNAVSIMEKDTKEVKKIDTDGLFLFIGHLPKTELVKDLVRLDDHGFIDVDKAMRTSCDGIFAAGDVCNRPYKQIVCAAGDGAQAIQSAQEYLDNE